MVYKKGGEYMVLSLLLSAVASMAIGFLWYSPVLFGAQWMKLKGYTNASLKKAQKQMGPLYGVSFIGALVMAWVLSLVFTWSGIIDTQEAIQTAFLMWLGFVAPVQLTHSIFGDKNWALLMIDTGYQLVSVVVMGIILTALV